ncbi:MAG: hypothetical protein ACLQNE_03520 [Thermoguttaceae bacterium]
MPDQTFLAQVDGSATGAPLVSRRGFFTKTALAAGGIVAARATLARPAEESPKPKPLQKPPNPQCLPNKGRPIKIFTCDFNWCAWDKPSYHVTLSAPQDWAFVDPDTYFNWHRDFGVNCFFAQAYTHSGYAFYPTRFGPVAPGSGNRLFGELFQRASKAGMPFCAYFSVGRDELMQTTRPEWRVPGGTFLAPESPWTDLLCARITEFLRLYPVEWINFDVFTYGVYRASRFKIQPAWFAKEPFREVIGRAMPDDAAKIAPEESLKYMREMLARQFHRIREAMHKGNPGTKANFNPPFFAPAEPLWADHPMLNECDQLVAESTDDVMPWLLKIRKPHQRVLTVITGRTDGVSDPNTWKRWYEAGCDFFGYAWGTPPDFRPHPRYAKELEITRNAYRTMP